MKESIDQTLVGKPGKTNKELISLLLQAYNTEVARKEKELNRSLTVAERTEIKINSEFLHKYNKQGLLPTMLSLQNRFGSISHLAKLASLPAVRDRQLSNYDERDKGIYLGKIRTYIKAFIEEHKHKPTPMELRNVFTIPNDFGVPTSIFDHVDVNNIFGIEHERERGGEKIISEDDLISAVRKAFEKKCQQEAVRLGKNNLTPEEKNKVKFKIREYDAFKEAGDPSSFTLTRRLGKEFGPSWEDVLKKADIK